MTLFNAAMQAACDSKVTYTTRIILSLRFVCLTLAIVLVYTNGAQAKLSNYAVDRTIYQEDFIILPKMTAKTNKCKISITIHNYSKLDIRAKLISSNMDWTEVSSKIDQITVKPDKVANLTYVLTFSKPYFGHVPSDLIEIHSMSGKLISKKLTPSLPVVNLPRLVQEAGGI